MQKHVFWNSIKHSLLVLAPAIVTAGYFAVVGLLALMLPYTRNSNLWHPKGFTDWVLVVLFVAVTVLAIILWVKRPRRLRYRLINVWLSAFVVIGWISLGLNYPLSITAAHAELKFKLIYLDLVLAVLGLAVASVVSLVMLNKRMSKQPWWLILILAIDAVFVPSLTNQYQQIAQVENLKSFKWSVFAAMMAHDHMPLAMLNILPQNFISAALLTAVLMGGVKIYGTVSQKVGPKIAAEAAA